MTTRRPSSKPDAAGRGSAARRQHQEQRAKLDALLDLLDARDAADAGREGRRAVRCRYRRTDVEASVHHPGGSTTERRVLTRDLSAGGLSLIHNGYLHVGTRVDATLRRHSGGADTVRGQVVHCSHISGPWHAVGLKFDRKLFPKLYLDPDAAADFDSNAGQPELVAGRVLLADANELDRRLVAHHLRRTRVELVGVATADEAEAALREAAEPFGLVLADAGLGEEAIGRLGSAAGGATLAVCTAESQEADGEGPAPADVLRKPYDGERLLAQVGRWLGRGGGGGDSAAGPIYSEMAGQAETGELLEAYVAEARRLAESIKASLDAGDADACRSACVRLRGSGGGYGFAGLSAAADEAVRAIEATAALSDAAGPLDRVRDLCARLSDGRPGEGTPPPPGRPA